MLCFGFKKSALQIKCIVIMTVLLQLQEPNQLFAEDTVLYFHQQPPEHMMIHLILSSVIDMIETRKQMNLH